LGVPSLKNSSSAHKLWAQPAAFLKNCGALKEAPEKSNALSQESLVFNSKELLKVMPTRTCCCRRRSESQNVLREQFARSLIL